MKFFKDKMAITSASILLVFGTWSWIQTGWFNVFTITMYSLALLLFIIRNYGK